MYPRYQSTAPDSNGTRSGGFTVTFAGRRLTAGAGGYGAVAAIMHLDHHLRFRASQLPVTSTHDLRGSDPLTATPTTASRIVSPCSLDDDDDDGNGRRHATGTTNACTPPAGSPYKIRDRIIRSTLLSCDIAPLGQALVPTDGIPHETEWSLVDDDFMMLVAPQTQHLCTLSRESSWVMASPPSRTTASSHATTPAAGMRLTASCGTDMCEDDVEEEDRNVERGHRLGLDRHEVSTDGATLAAQLLEWDLMSPQ